MIRNTGGEASWRNMHCFGVTKVLGTKGGLNGQVNLLLVSDWLIYSQTLFT